jgi:hypothetical protein
MVLQKFWHLSFLLMSVQKPVIWTMLSTLLQASLRALRYLWLETDIYDFWSFIISNYGSCTFCAHPHRVSASEAFLPWNLSMARSDCSSTSTLSVWLCLPTDVLLLAHIYVAVTSGPQLAWLLSWVGGQAFSVGNAGERPFLVKSSRAPKGLVSQEAASAVGWMVDRFIYCPAYLWLDA